MLRWQQSGLIGCLAATPVEKPDGAADAHDIAGERIDLLVVRDENHGGASPQRRDHALHDFGVALIEVGGRFIEEHECCAGIDAEERAGDSEPAGLAGAQLLRAGCGDVLQVELRRSASMRASPRRRAVRVQFEFAPDGLADEIAGAGGARRCWRSGFPSSIRVIVDVVASFAAGRRAGRAPSIFRLRSLPEER